MEFVNKEYFILLTLLIPYIIWYWRNRKHSEPTMRVSTVVAYYKAPKSWRQRIVHTPMFLRCLAFVMIVCVMAMVVKADLELSPIMVGFLRRSIEKEIVHRLKAQCVLS
jgi:hypothetical protein